MNYIFFLFFIFISCENKNFEIQNENEKLIQKISERNEFLSYNEEYRLFFNRNPKFEKENPLISSFSQGRYSVKLHTDNEELLYSKSCKNCHKKEYNLWNESLHSKSFSNPRFKIAFEKEPQAWCLNCHSPLWNFEQENKIEIENTSQEFYKTNNNLYIFQRKEKTDYLKKEYKYQNYDTKLNREGVNCATCHVRNNSIYTAKTFFSLNGIYSKIFSKHKLKQDLKLNSVDFCAGCHEFNFPLRNHPIIEYSNFPMQTTVSEFKKIDSKKEVSCNSCHFNKSNHISSNLLNPEEFKKNFRFEFDFKNQTKELELKIEIPKIGHEFPTGDLFRQVHIKVYKENIEIEKLILAKEANISKHKLEFNTRLVPNEEFSILKIFQLKLKTIPDKCLIEYHLQGKIDKSLESKISKKERIIELYNGSCF